jgi:murein DD-endopeptidase MepM/ murein hydrolase activator NlpD
VVFSGWANGGYGNMVMIDHGNGWQTVYAHMERSSVVCGQSVAQGSTIGFSGSTGNSTGPHLHFETRYLDGFVNPWYVLP